MNFGYATTKADAVRSLSDPLILAKVIIVNYRDADNLEIVSPERSPYAKQLLAALNGRSSSEVVPGYRFVTYDGTLEHLQRLVANIN